MSEEQIQTAPSSEGGFLSESQIIPRLGISRRTLANWRNKGVIPYIRPPGGRRILFDWDSVRAALLRRQTGTATRDQ
jgi:predicted site-specific integrase-resolvase